MSDPTEPTEITEPDQPIEPIASDDASGESDRPQPEVASSAPARGEVLLEVDHVTLRFGGVVALNDVDFQIHEGEILGLIGPNGAGKTTCFNAMTGVYTPTEGEIRFRGETVSGQKKHVITRRGIARTFQNIRLFPEMTALENVLVGADARHRSSVPGVLFRGKRVRDLKDEELPENGLKRGLANVFGLSRHTLEERAAHELGMQLLEFVGIADRAEESARNLPYGYQRRLEIARALATEPKLLCLDEPAAGFNPIEKERLMELIRKIRDQGVTVLLIEHDMKLVMGVTDRIVVLEFGQKIADGLPSEVSVDPRVIAAYLGEPDDAASA